MCTISTFMAISTGNTLKTIRSELNYVSAKSFYEYLISKGASGFNYSYYMRLERGSLPSAAVVETIAKLVPKELGESLIKSFCRSQFESYSYLFENEMLHHEVSQDSSPKPMKQKELTIFQVSEIIKSKNHYDLFLVMTLARRALSLKEIKAHFKNISIESVINDFLEANLIYENDSTYISACNEYQFPKSSGDNFLEKSYKQMDEWDKLFSGKFNFSEIVNKMLIRRISLRYVGIIQNQLMSVIDVAKSSDETDQRYNDHVIHMGLLLNCGKVIG